MIRVDVTLCTLTGMGSVALGAAVPFPDSRQSSCFSTHCPHHGTLAQCVQGSYLCRHGEFCELTTHTSHGNTAWLVMHCRPPAIRQSCLLNQASNHPDCDPNNHHSVCHWCCEDEQCMTDMVNGILPGQSATAAATTATPAPVRTTAVPMSTDPPVVDVTTTSSGVVRCSDLYLGDCSADLAGRCEETMVQAMCAETCNKCP